MRFHSAARRAAALPAVLAAAAVLLVAACSIGPSSHTTSNTRGAAPTASPSPSGMPGMPGMTEPMPVGDGLSASESGFSMVPATTITANTANAFTFRITVPDGAPVSPICIRPDLERCRLSLCHGVRSNLYGTGHHGSFGFVPDVGISSHSDAARTATR